MPALDRLLRTPLLRKGLRYCAASAVAVVVSEVVLFLVFGLWQLADAVVSQLIASAVAAIPSYFLNRYWVWSKRGRSDLWREVVPFWGLALLGVGFSLATDKAGAAIARAAGLPHLWVAVVVDGASLVGFGIVWVGKFVIFDKVLFTQPPAPDRGEGRTS